MLPFAVETCSRSLRSRAAEVELELSVICADAGGGNLRLRSGEARNNPDLISRGGEKTRVNLKTIGPGVPKVA